MLLDSVYKSGEDSFDNAVKRMVNLDLYTAVINSFEKNGGASSIQSKKNIIETIKSRIEELPVLNIVLAVPPNRELTEKIHNWAKINLEENIVLELSDDASLIGGARISYAGKYVDNTLLKRWPSIWEKARKDILD
jgi:hypothetical protein